MEVKEQINLHFHDVDIVGVNFEALKPFDNSIQLGLNIVPKVFYPSNNPLEFKIMFETKVQAEGYFELEVRAIGHFSFQQALDEETKKRWVNHNAPAIMFPYVRAFITTFTSNLGNTTGSIVLPPHFFSGQLEEVASPE